MELGKEKDKCEYCGKEVEYSVSPTCLSCEMKSKEKELHCKDCGKSIDWGNFFYLARRCEDCFENLEEGVYNWEGEILDNVYQIRNQ